MKNSAELSADEKKHYCDRLTEELVELRKRLGQTQEELEAISGISRVTLSQIESGRCRMSWLHFTSLMEMFSQNQETKELLFVRGILDERLLRVYQHVRPGERPEYNAIVPEPGPVPPKHYLLPEEDEGAEEEAE